MRNTESCDTMVASDRSVLTTNSSADGIRSVDDIKIGTRVGCTDDIGTVKYVGELSGYKGPWLGIDWDNPSRGKHNGSVSGVNYFTARRPTSGSFVRPHKVQMGVKADEAVKRKYGMVTDETVERLNQQRLLSVTRSINAPFLQLVGFGKLEKIQSDFKGLRVVCLRGMHVNERGDLSALSELCPNLYELDLSLNLFTSWDSIISICKNMKRLEKLNVSENLLNISTEVVQSRLPSLKMLICGEMCLTWNNIVHLSQMWPNLEELRSPLNVLTNLDSQLDVRNVFPKLRTLYLQNNPIRSWDEIVKIGVLDSLQKIVLRDCQIQHIKFKSCPPTEKTELFKNLKFLSVAENNIDNWESISELEKLQNLRDLRIPKNPLDQTESSATCFQLIVARIGNLTNLNGTDLQPEDKRGAEYDYLKKHANEWIQIQNNEELRAQFVAKHPRYPILVQKYGSPEKIDKDQDSSLKSNLIELHIINVDGDKTIVKKLPPNMLVQKLNTLIQRLFSLENTPKLSYVSAKGAEHEREMDSDYKDLRFYSLQSGDKIFVKQL